MRKMYLTIAGMAMAACLMVSCSGAPKEKEVTVSNVDITGFMKDYIKVVDGSYKFTNDGEEAFITVKFELADSPSVDYQTHEYTGIKLNALGANGETLDTGYFGFTATQDEFKKLDALMSGNVGDTKNVTFKWDYYDEEKGKAMFENAVSFELVDNGFEAKTEDDSSTGTDYEASVDTDYETEESSDSTSDWDEVLDEYEEYIDNYVKLMKKAKNGDMSALTECADLMENAESLGNKLDNAKGSMSSAQLQRYMKLHGKLATAAM